MSLGNVTSSIYKSVIMAMVLVPQHKREINMIREPNESFFIGDTDDGQVLLTRSSAAELVAGPRQLLLISGKDHVIPPKMLMSRREFRVWREELQDEGCKVELRFAS
jgi:hypothetical protein